MSGSAAILRASAVDCCCGGAKRLRQNVSSEGCLAALQKAR